MTDTDEVRAQELVETAYHAAREALHEPMIAYFEQMRADDIPPSAVMLALAAFVGGLCGIFVSSQVAPPKRRPAMELVDRAFRRGMEHECMQCREEAHAAD